MQSHCEIVYSRSGVTNESQEVAVDEIHDHSALCTFASTNCIERRVIEDFSLKLRKTVDAIAIATALLNHGDCNQFISELIRANIRGGSSREEMWNILLPNIPLNCSFSSFWLALYSSGYDILSTEISKHFWQYHLTVGPRRTECKRQDYFLRLKVCFHDQVFKQPHQLFLETSERHRIKYEDANDAKGKMRAADRYADCLCVLIDTKAPDFLGKFPTHNLFESLKAIIPETSNTSLTEVAYYSRLAIAHGMANDMETGRRCMAQAQAAAFQIEQNVQYVYNMLYIHIHFLCMQVERPTSNDIDRILDVTRRFLQNLPVPDEGAVFWKKMLLLRSAFFLLGFSHRGVVNELHRVEKSHVVVAKIFLAEIDAHWDGIEYVRRLFYYVCKARIQELKHKDIYDENGEGDRHQQEIVTLHFRAAIDQLDKTIEEGQREQHPQLFLAEMYSCRLRSKIGNFRYLLHIFTLYIQLFIRFILGWRNF
ncbi:uncharacterized protein LOC110464915 [Mizuhopecten yessoensis]|uniref:Uncharacterized protein n=1 Tax=Mizuhopecten yessoensis TaxID=6573 RepID=A0A210PSR8_MIZYE|nr:uncharacterized protein LOC110464915 [Mizuhopecten yessoensis]XP_021376066.1 uncharacterized protein LOC110464915 [Mizuhopecten yessoensis]OWF39547.1 hypothetical protein KP79_PYT23315 [Mizuhopecten yessoensis]